jgi:sugar phosphate isomerase/epimerase
VEDGYEVPGIRYTVSSTIDPDLDSGLASLNAEGFEAEIIPYHLPDGMDRDIYSIHLPFRNIHLTDPDPETREMSVDAIKAWLHVYAGNAEVAVLHVEGMPPEGVDYIERRENFLSSARDILDTARECGIDIAIENEVPFLHGYETAYTAPWELRGIIKELRDEGYDANVCLDVGHAYVASQAYDIPFDQFIEALGEYTIHVHMHDNDGRSDLHQPVSGSLPDDVYRQVATLPHLRVVDIEMREGYTIEDAVASREHLERYF